MSPRLVPRAGGKPSQTHRFRTPPSPEGSFFSEQRGRVLRTGL
jgi:hypothetical protein